jgi:predicted DNA-binding transcriptional regulator AlpA
MEREYLAVCEVAQLIGCSEKTIYKIGKSLPGYTRIGTLIRFHKATLLDGLAKPKRPPSADNKHGL